MKSVWLIGHLFDLYKKEVSLAVTPLFYFFLNFLIVKMKLF